MAGKGREEKQRYRVKVSPSRGQLDTVLRSSIESAAVELLAHLLEKVEPRRNSKKTERNEKKERCPASRAIRSVYRYSLQPPLDVFDAYERFCWKRRRFERAFSSTKPSFSPLLPSLSSLRTPLLYRLRHPRRLPRRHRSLYAFRAVEN